MVIAASSESPLIHKAGIDLRREAKGFRSRFCEDTWEVMLTQLLGGKAMNIYDKAHELARAIKESSEVADITAALKLVEADPESSRMLNHFRSSQQELQERMMAGEMPAPEEMEKMEKLFEVLNLNLGIRRLFEAERRLSVVIEDVNKIISGSLEHLYGADV